MSIKICVSIDEALLIKFDCIKPTYASRSAMISELIYNYICEKESGNNGKNENPRKV